MTEYTTWLPELVLFGDYGGDWERYVNELYRHFEKDFVQSKPFFKGTRLALKRHPMFQGKEATFWHLISEGKEEEDRIPDLRRCERIRWPRPIIENNGCSDIKIWKNQRGREQRICIWLEPENFLVVLADREKYILFWTAYLVEQPHRQRKLRKEYGEYRRKADTKS